jgi:hypothetical protein
VLFTADLKSFSSYGLPTPPQSTPSRTIEDHSQHSLPKIPSAGLALSASRSKRKSAARPITGSGDMQALLSTYVEDTEEMRLAAESGTSLAERVKKRRRMSAVVRKDE